MAGPAEYYRIQRDVATSKLLTRKLCRPTEFIDQLGPETIQENHPKPQSANPLQQIRSSHFNPGSPVFQPQELQTSQKTCIEKSFANRQPQTLFTAVPIFLPEFLKAGRLPVCRPESRNQFTSSCAGRSAVQPLQDQPERKCWAQERSNPRSKSCRCRSRHPTR